MPGSVRTLLRNTRIVLPEQVLESGSLLIEDEQIARVIEGASAASVNADSIIDLNGASLFPGYIDIHIHGAIGVDVNSATVSDLRRVSELLAGKGVTAWL